jgi:hypothetical protein
MLTYFWPVSGHSVIAVGFGKKIETNLIQYVTGEDDISLCYESFKKGSHAFILTFTSTLYLTHSSHIITTSLRTKNNGNRQPRC